MTSSGHPTAQQDQNFWLMLDQLPSFPQAHQAFEATDDFGGGSFAPSEWDPPFAPADLPQQSGFGLPTSTVDDLPLLSTGTPLNLSRQNLEPSCWAFPDLQSSQQRCNPDTVQQLWEQRPNVGSTGAPSRNTNRAAICGHCSAISQDSRPTGPVTAPGSAPCGQHNCLADLEDTIALPCMPRVVTDTTYAKPSASSQLNPPSPPTSDVQASQMRPPTLLADSDRDATAKRGRRNPPAKRADTAPDAPAKRTPHSTTERKYRDKLNYKLALLRRTLLSAGLAPEDSDDADDQGNGEKAADKVSKGNILSDAMRYIRQAEADKMRMEEEVAYMKLRVAALEKLVRCESCTLLDQFVHLQLRQPASYGAVMG